MNLISRHVATRQRGRFRCVRAAPDVGNKDGSKSRAFCLASWLGSREGFALPTSHNGASCDGPAQTGECSSPTSDPHPPPLRTRLPDEPAVRSSRPLSLTLPYTQPTPDPRGPRGQRAQITRSTPTSRVPIGDVMATASADPGRSHRASRPPPSEHPRRRGSPRRRVLNNLAAHTPSGDFEELPIRGARAGLSGGQARVGDVPPASGGSSEVQSRRRWRAPKDSAARR